MDVKLKEDLSPEDKALAEKIKREIEENNRIEQEKKKLDTRFQDDKKTKSHIISMRTCRSPTELLKIVNKAFPGWIYDVCDNFESDLTPLIENWNTICRRSNTKPMNILLVEKFAFHSDDDADKYSGLLCALNNLTKQGYCVREMAELTSCLTKNCNNVMICKEIRNKLYEKGQCERPFTNICIDCIRGGVV